MFGVPLASGESSSEVVLVYPNGYGYRFTMIAGHEAHRAVEDYDPFIFYIRLVRNNLKTVANGGKVESSSGWDIRFETTTRLKLPHVILSYVPTTGEVRARVRHKLQVDTDLILYLYYGKAGLTAPEADGALCFSGYTCAVDLTTGIDHSGRGLDLTLESVTASSINTMPAGDFLQ